MSGFVVPSYLRDLRDEAVFADVDPDPIGTLRAAIDALVRPRVTVVVPEGTPDDIVAAIRTLPTVRDVDTSTMVPPGTVYVLDPEGHLG